MINKQDLIGKPYPVKDQDNNVVGTKPIVSVHDMEDIAGYGIQLSENGPVIVISFFDALDLLEK